MYEIELETGLKEFAEVEKVFGRSIYLSCDQNTLPFIKLYLQVCSLIHVPMAKKWMTAVVLIL